jgi:glycosyltransferase involved in cell wall biosynthesis
VSGHLLLTSWAFPPARTSGVYRAVAIANVFADAGWRVTALCGPADLFRANGVVDETLVETVHPSVDIVEVPLEHHELSSDIGQWGWLRARQPEIWAKRRLRRDHRRFPEAWYGSWAQPLRAAADRVHRQHPVTLALGTAAPAVDFVPGEHLHARFGVPYILDYRDAWTFQTFTGGDSPLFTEAVRDREESLMRSAFQVWFVNDPIRLWHVGRYPAAGARMRVVRNGFDLPVGTSDAAAVAVPWRPTDGHGVTFGYIGTINFGAFPLEEVVEGWRSARSRLPAGSRLVLRGHLGRTGEAGPALAAALTDAATIGIDYEGPVARRDVWSVYREFDALLLALPSGPGVTSGKVYEYAATGLPIVSVHTPETPVAEVLGGLPHWHAAATLDHSDVADAFVAAAAAVGSGGEDARRHAVVAAGRWERTRIMHAAVAEVEFELAQAVT